VASLGMVELGDEEMTGVIPVTEDLNKDTWVDIGYYYDDKGIKRYGPIPSKKQFNNVKLKQEIDYDS